MFDIQVGVYNDPFKDRISFNASASDATLEALGMGAQTLVEQRRRAASFIGGDGRSNDLGECHAREFRRFAKPAAIDGEQLGELWRRKLKRC